jgi:hypothetical protein
MLFCASCPAEFLFAAIVCQMVSVPASPEGYGSRDQHTLFNKLDPGSRSLPHFLGHPTWLALFILYYGYKICNLEAFDPSHEENSLTHMDRWCAIARPLEFFELTGG